MSALITIKNLSCERDERLLFQGLTTDFQAGQVVQIAGPNGAGKTTFLKILTGLSNLYEGEILWQGKKRDHYAFYSSLLYLGHMPAVKSSMTALENLNWYFGLNGLKRSDAGKAVIPDRKLMQDALYKVGLKGYEDVPCFQMSAGQQRRVALARLYCSEAPLWILDEPFTAIDKKGVENLEGLIKAHTEKGGLVILTTHQPLKIENYRILDLGNYSRKQGSNAEQGDGA